MWVTRTLPVFRSTWTTATVATVPTTATPRPLTIRPLDELAGFGPGRDDQPDSVATTWATMTARVDGRYVSRKAIGSRPAAVASSSSNCSLANPVCGPVGARRCAERRPVPSAWLHET